MLTCFNSSDILKEPWEGQTMLKPETIQKHKINKTNPRKQIQEEVPASPEPNLVPLAGIACVIFVIILILAHL